ncbi:hypothetical protein X943_001050 [Babesia divergens]|uniref:Uncharacterized protein n=1 Tax=Babesia divergens TaxID=32595 RepID=A0AAD9LK24_BABDI|nr:hypothetical protein X943_001050 [Babesia divergens]
MREALTILKQVGVRRPGTSSISHYYVQRRWLGQAPSGRQLKGIDTTWEEAKKLFYKPALSYGEFAKRVDAFRIFAFWALVGGLTLDLFINPPQSQYWTKWNMLKMPSRLLDKINVKPEARDLPPLPALGNDHMTDAAREYTRVCNI